jgi:hypothetical protein
MSSKPGTKSKFSGESEASAEYAGIKAEEKRKEGAEFETSDEISWKHNGTDWVPVSAKLQSFTVSNLNSKLNASETVVTVNRKTSLILNQLRFVPSLGIAWESWAERTTALEKSLKAQVNALDIERTRLSQAISQIEAQDVRFKSLIAPLQAYVDGLKNFDKLEAECKARGVRYSWVLQTRTCNHSDK